MKKVFHIGLPELSEEELIALGELAQEEIIDYVFEHLTRSEVKDIEVEKRLRKIAGQNKAQELPE